MANETNTHSLLTRTVSWVALVVALGCLLFLALFVPTDRQVFARVLADFKIELPTLTVFVLSIPDSAFFAITAALALVCIVVQVRYRASGAVALFHILIIVVCCGAFVVYREAVIRPVVMLIGAFNK